MSLLEADNTRKTTELEEARLVHLSLLPTQLPELPDIDVAVHMRSATEVGGDYYDYALTDDGGLALAVGDATGHGLKAGFLGATAKSYFQTMSGRSSVREIIEAMSVAFRNLRLPSLYMCLVLMRIHQGTLSVVGAGMPPIFLRRHATGAVERVEVHGTPLGFHGPFSCDERVLPFEPGDALLVASDGLSDLFNDEDEELGYERIERCLAAADGTAESILGEVLAMVDAWLGGRPLTDDVTVMTIKAR
jgi:sigma-B regulation protein RsbU (phosphoserine phosphatase)